MKPPQAAVVASVGDTTSSSGSGSGSRAWGQMAAGGMAGSLGKTITAPLSRLTILYQVSPLLAASSSSAAAASMHYPTSLSLGAAVRRILQTEGVLAFWRGNLTSVLHRFPYSAINFASYEAAKDLLVGRLKLRESPETRLLCGAIAGAAACFACYPLDLVRTRLTVTASSSASRPGLISAASTSIYGTLAQVVRDEGVRGLYRGLLISLAVSVPNLAIGFSVYGSMKEECLRSGSSLLMLPATPPSLGGGGGSSEGESNPARLSPLGCIVSGAASGILSSLVVFPADTVRRRMQVRGLVVGSQSGVSESLRIVRAEGLLGLYRGIVPELLKVVPMVSVTFATYEFLSREFEKREKTR